MRAAWQLALAPLVAEPLAWRPAAEQRKWLAQTESPTLEAQFQQASRALEFSQVALPLAVLRLQAT